MNWIPQFESGFIQVNHSDARQCNFVLSLLKCPRVKPFSDSRRSFSVTVDVFFLLNTRANTRTLSVGAPEEEITWTGHNLWVSAQTVFVWFFLFKKKKFLFEVTCRATVQAHGDAHYCIVHHSSVGLQKHSIFQNRVYTFLLNLGDVFGFFFFFFGSGEKINHLSPSPTPPNYIPDGAEELSTQGLFCV